MRILGLAAVLTSAAVLGACGTSSQSGAAKRGAAWGVQVIPDSLLAGPPARSEAPQGANEEPPAFTDDTRFWGDLEFDEFEHGEDSKLVGRYTHQLDEAYAGRRYQASWSIIFFANNGFRKQFEGGSILQPDGTTTEYPHAEPFYGLWVPENDAEPNDGEGILMIGEGEKQPKRYAIYVATDDSLTFRPGLGDLDEAEVWTRVKD